MRKLFAVRAYIGQHRDPFNLLLEQAAEAGISHKRLKQGDPGIPATSTSAESGK